MPLTGKEKERYLRHILLKEVGEEGQEKLLKSKVLVIGAGGLGSPVCMYLAAAGIGTIGIADADVVDESNLQRQIMHTTPEIGKAKVLSAKDKMKAINPEVNVKTYQEYIDSENIMDIIDDYDFIVDAADNFETKFLINDACVLKKKAFVHAGIMEFKGQLMTYVPGEGPCYRCIFGNPPGKDEVPAASTLGIIGSMAGVIGSLEAMETVKYITGVGKLLTGRFLTYDALTMEFRTVKFGKANKACPVCGENPTIEI